MPHVRAASKLTALMDPLCCHRCYSLLLPLTLGCAHYALGLVQDALGNELVPLRSVIRLPCERFIVCMLALGVRQRKRRGDGNCANP